MNGQPWLRLTVPLGLVLLCAPGCGGDSTMQMPTGPLTDPPAPKTYSADGGYAASPEPTPGDGKLVALTTMINSPITMHLSAKHPVVDAKDFLAQFDFGKWSGDPKELTKGVSALVADADMYDEASATEFHHLLHAARHSRVPLLVENMHKNNNHQKVISLFGVAAPAQAALMSHDESGTVHDITLLGPAGALGGSAGSSAKTVKKMSSSSKGLTSGGPDTGSTESSLAEATPLSISSAASLRQLPAAASLSLAAVASPPSIDELANQVEWLIQRAASPSHAETVHSNNPPYGTVEIYNLSNAGVSNPLLNRSGVGGTVQTANISVGWQVVLAATSALNGAANPQKLLYVSTTGAGFNPGTMYNTSSSDKGYFQDDLQITMCPGSGTVTAPSGSFGTTTAFSECSSNSNLNFVAAFPQPQNPTTSVQNTSGFTVGGTAGVGQMMTGVSATGTYSQMNTVSYSYQDFTTAWQGTGLNAHWDFYMTADGASATNPYSLVNNAISGVSINSPAMLATTSFVPNAEVIYSASNSYAGTVPLMLTAYQHLDEVWEQNACCSSWDVICTGCFSSNSAYYNKWAPTPVTVDFKIVDGTNPPVPLCYNTGSGSLCATGIGNTTNTGAYFTMYNFWKGENQLFRWNPVPNQTATYTLGPLNTTSLCLTVDGSNNLVQNTCNNSSAQYFKKVTITSSSYQLQNNGKCLTGSGTSGAMPVGLTMTSCVNGQQNQVWNNIPM